MLKTVFTLIAVTLIGYVGYLWTCHEPAVNSQETQTTKRSTRRDVLKVIQEMELQAEASRSKIYEFSSRAKHLKNMSALTLSHIQSILKKETRVQNDTKAFESKPRIMSNSINHNKPIYPDIDGNIPPRRDVKPSSYTDAETLAEIHRCKDIIANEKQHFEKLHNRQINTLRRAKRRLLQMQPQLTKLCEKISKYRNQHTPFCEYEVDPDTYSNLRNEARQAAEEIERSLTDYSSSVDSNVKQLLRDSSTETISSSSDAIDRALARVSTLVAGERLVNAAGDGASMHPRRVESKYSPNN